VQALVNVGRNYNGPKVHYILFIKCSEGLGLIIEVFLKDRSKQLNSTV